GDAAVYGGLNLALLADPARPFLAKRAAVYRVQRPRHLLPSVRRARGPYSTCVFALCGRPRDGDGTLGAPPVVGLLSRPVSGVSGNRWDVIRVLCAPRAPIRRKLSCAGGAWNVPSVVPPRGPRAALRLAGALGQSGVGGCRGHGWSVHRRMDCLPPNRCARRGLLAVLGDFAVPDRHADPALFFGYSLLLVLAALLSDPGWERPARGVAGGHNTH